MMTNNTAPGALRYVKGGSTKLAGYLLQAVSDDDQISDGRAIRDARIGGDMGDGDRLIAARHKLPPYHLH
jgi:hypothetical protein